MDLDKEGSLNLDADSDDGKKQIALEGDLGEPPSISAQVLVNKPSADEDFDR